MSAQVLTSTMTPLMIFGTQSQECSQSLPQLASKALVVMVLLASTELMMVFARAPTRRT